MIYGPGGVPYLITNIQGNYTVAVAGSDGTVMPAIVDNRQKAIDASKGFIPGSVKG